MIRWKHGGHERHERNRTQKTWDTWDTEWEGRFDILESLETWETLKPLFASQVHRKSFPLLIGLWQEENPQIYSQAQMQVNRE